MLYVRNIHPSIRLLLLLLLLLRSLIIRWLHTPFAYVILIPRAFPSWTNDKIVYNGISPDTSILQVTLPRLRGIFFVFSKDHRHNHSWIVWARVICYSGFGSFPGNGFVVRPHLESKLCFSSYTILFLEIPSKLYRRDGRKHLYIAPKVAGWCRWRIRQTAIQRDSNSAPE